MSKTNQVFKCLILLFTLFVSFKSLAEGWGEIRICSENSNARHYTAVAQTQCSGLWGPKRASQARCVYDVEAQVKYYNVGGKVIAEQKTKFGPLGFSSTGGTYRNRCSRGGFINELMQTLTTNDEQGDSINEVCNITTGTIEFNNNEKTISINSINGYQSVDCLGFLLKFRIVIWEPVNSNDSVITNSKIKWEGWVVQENGITTLLNFNNTEISNSFYNGIYKLEFNNFNKVVVFPSSINVNNLAVRIESHSEPIISSQPNLFIEETKQLINQKILIFNLISNPTKDNLKIEFCDYTKIDNLELFVFDAFGKLTNVDYSKELKGDFIYFNVDCVEIKPGGYFVLIRSNKKNYVLKFLKE